ncbi:MAG: protein kinase [Myxococcales bacterium]|nr:protein kinase [Myxococcales bacterium]MCB9520721.1 protein kinase [Myxococcales bacterium]MCB9532125.1 protein kinase [Myxococcales bacterium]
MEPDSPSDLPSPERADTSSQVQGNEVAPATDDDASPEFQVVPEDFLVPGDIVASRYRVIRSLGSGGFAQVYLASHTEIDSMRVAIKVLHPHRTTPEALDRFRNEAKLLAMLQNRHTVRLIDFGVTETPMAYLVMEYVRGVALDALLRDRGRLAEADVARVAIGVLKSLVEAHSVGVIHRDLKPANIVLVSEPGERFVVPRVLDFGIAKVMGGGSPVEDEIQQEDGSWEPVVYCTPAYAAPELLRGRPDFATDLYALGLVLIELLEGCPPYEYPDPEPSASPHLWDEPVPLGPHVEGSELASVVRRAVAKELEDRYVAAEHMLRDVEEAYERIRKKTSSASALEVAEDTNPPVPADRRAPSQAARFVATSVVGLAGALEARAARLRDRDARRQRPTTSPALAPRPPRGAAATPPSSGADARRPDSAAELATPRDARTDAPTTSFAPASDGTHDGPPPPVRVPGLRSSRDEKSVVEVALFGQRVFSPRPTLPTVLVVIAAIALPALVAVWSAVQFLRGETQHPVVVSDEE